MPYCQLSVSCDLTKEKIADLSSQIHDALVSIADKPSTAIMINIIPNSHLFLNKKGDAAFFEVTAVNMDNDLIEKIGVKFLDIISTMTGIDYNRIFVHFHLSEREKWVMRGHSLSYWKEQWNLEGKKGFSD